jgi:GAF domain-containing protein/HAMP domain-containing protein
MKWTQRLVDFFATSLQRKLLLAITAIVTLAIIGFGVYLINTQRQRATAELQARATRTVELLSETIALPLWNIDTGSMESQLDAVMVDPEVSAVRVIETGNTEPIVKKGGDVPPVNPISQKAEVIYSRGEDKIPLGTIEIVYSSERLNRDLWETSLLIGGIVVVLVVLLFVSISWMVARFVTNPLHEMTKLTSHISAGDLTGRASVNSRDEMNTLATAFNSMITQLSQTLENLEQRVKDRTTDLEISKSVTEKHAGDLEAVAEISHSMALIQDIDELLPTIAILISSRYGFYHTGIYLIDEAREYAVLSAASSEAGQRLLENKHKLRIEPTSLVGYAASSGQIRVAADVTQDSNYMALSDLSDTRSEVVLPLVAGTEIIGVMDVESAEINAFTEQEVSLLHTLANLAAVSIQNARSFSETRRALAESERVYQQFVQQGWGRIIRKKSILGYKYSPEGLAPITSAPKAETTSPSEETLGIDQREQPDFLSIPLKLRDQTIGIMRVRSTKSSREWDEDELAMIQATADRAVLALENARLLEDSQRRVTKERVISDIAAKITGSVSMDNILKTAVEELGQAIPSAEVLVQFHSPETGD